MTEIFAAAFPSHSEGVFPELGLSKREYIAAMVYPALLRDYNEALRRQEVGPEPGWMAGIANDAVAIADEIMTAAYLRDVR